MGEWKIAGIGLRPKIMEDGKSEIDVFSTPEILAIRHNAEIAELTAERDEYKRQRDAVLAMLEPGIEPDIPNTASHTIWRQSRDIHARAPRNRGGQGMKRYEIDYSDVYNVEILEHPEGDWYRVEDVHAEIERRTFVAEQKAEQWQTACEAATIERDALRAVLADCLKPVPVGDLCRWDLFPYGRYVLHEGHICKPVRQHMDLVRLTDGHRYDMRDAYCRDELFQPVRLVPAMEVMSHE